MQEIHDLSDEQALCLQRILRNRDPASAEDLAVTEDVLDELVQQRLVRRWRDGSVEITLGGMREVARRARVGDDARVAGFESASA
jgi:hypothetical protein